MKLSNKALRRIAQTLEGKKFANRHVAQSAADDPDVEERLFRLMREIGVHSLSVDEIFKVMSSEEALKYIYLLAKEWGVDLDEKSSVHSDIFDIEWPDLLRRGF